MFSGILTQECMRSSYTESAGAGNPGVRERPDWNCNVLFMALEGPVDRRTTLGAEVIRGAADVAGAELGRR